MFLNCPSPNIQVAQLCCPIQIYIKSITEIKTYEEHAERHEIEEDAALVARRGTRTVRERPEQVGRRIHMVARIHLRPAQVVPIPIRTQSSLQVQVYWKCSVRVYQYTRRDSSRDTEMLNIVITLNVVPVCHQLALRKILFHTRGFDRANERLAELQLVDLNWQLETSPNISPIHLVNKYTIIHITHSNPQYTVLMFIYCVQWTALTPV